MRAEEPVNIPKESTEKEETKKEEEEEDIDDLGLLGYPKKNYEKFVFFLPVLAVLLSIASFFIRVIPDHSCPSHLNDAEFHKTVRFMSRLQQTFHRGEDMEVIFDDLAIILNELENKEFEKAFLENSWNTSFVKTLMKIAKKSSDSCKKGKSVTLLLYTLQTIRQIFDFGVNKNNTKMCMKSLGNPSDLIEIANKCDTNELVLETVLHTMTTSLLLPCSEGIYNKFIPKIIALGDNDKFDDIEKSIMAFLTIYSDVTVNVNATKENVDAICERTKNSVIHAKTATGEDAERLCFLIKKFNCSGIPGLQYRMLFRSDACRKYR